MGLRYVVAPCREDITEIKTNNKPVDIIKLTFDGLQILQSKPVQGVKAISLKHSQDPSVLCMASQLNRAWLY